MLLAEDLLLVLTDDDTGGLTASGAQVDLALADALLVALALMGRVDVRALTTWAGGIQAAQA